MPDEAEIQDETPTPTHPVPVWAREEAQQISEQDWEKLVEAAKTVFRIRREAKKMETRERKKESKS